MNSNVEQPVGHICSNSLHGLEVHLVSKKINVKFNFQKHFINRKWVEVITINLCLYLHVALRNRLKQGATFKVNILNDQLNKDMEDGWTGHWFCGTSKVQHVKENFQMHMNRKTNSLLDLTYR